jgi:hypothetical protein
VGKGVDYSAGHPGGAALAAGGFEFAARYVSTPGNPKNLTAAEAADLAAHGVWAAVVFETTAGRALAGRSAGATDAQKALQQARALGMPAGRPVYMAVDQDVTDPSRVAPYFQGAASVLGLPALGVYGGYGVVKYLLDHGLVTFAWQTAAWSRGMWDTRAHIRQYATTIKVNGVSCDLDESIHPDYGQWKPGVSPNAEEDVALTDAEITKIATLSAKLTLQALGAPAGVLATIDNPAVADDPKNPTKDDESVRALLWDTGMHSAHADVKLDTVLAALPKLLAATGADPAAFSKAVADDLAKRLES